MSAGLGVYWEPTDSPELGLSYTSQPGFGETKMTGDAHDAARRERAPARPTVDVLRRPTRTSSASVPPGGSARSGRFAATSSSSAGACSTSSASSAKGTTCDVASDGRVPDMRRHPQHSAQLEQRDRPPYGTGVPAQRATRALRQPRLHDPCRPEGDHRRLHDRRVPSLRHARCGASSLSKHFALGASYNHIYFFDVNTNGKNIQNIPNKPGELPGGRRLQRLTKPERRRRGTAPRSAS